MNELRFHKSARLIRETEPLKILIDLPFPELHIDKWETELREFFTLEGKGIADALMTTLPGGTVDALLAELMRRRAGLLTVRIGAE